MTERERTPGEEFLEKRDYSYPGLPEFFDADPEWASRYDDLADLVLRSDEEMSRKTRELIIVAFAAAKGRKDACKRHISLARDHGASDGELHETIQLASHAGGAWSMTTGAAALAELKETDD